MRDRGRIMATKMGDTPKYRKLFPIFWDDDRVRTLDEGEQLLAVYILTSRQTNKIGLFRFSLAACAEDLSKPLNTIAKRIAKVCDTLEWKYDSDARCLYIPSWWKYNPPANVKNMVGNLRDLAELPNTVLLYEFAANETHLSGGVLDTLRQRMRYLADTNPISGTITITGALTGAGALTQSGEIPSPVDVVSEHFVPEPILDVFAHYRTYHARAFPTPVPASKEWKLIAARLREGFSVDDLKAAIDGNHASPFHNGENDGGKKYNALELIVRDGSKVTSFIDVSSRGTGPVLSEKSQRTLRAKEEFLRRELEATRECN